MQELKLAYFKERQKKAESFPKLYPIEESISGEDGTRGYRYLIFPVLNQNLYINEKIFDQSHLALNLDRKL